MAVIYNKFTVFSFLASFVVYFLKLKLILFYNKVNYYYSRTFLIFLPHIYIYIYIYIYRMRKNRANS